MACKNSMLHGSKTRPVRKENEVALRRAEMRMVRWMCNVKVKDRVPSKELREILGRPKRSWKAVVQKDCQARNLNKEDAMDRGRWKPLIKIG